MHQVAKVLEFQLQHQSFNEYSGLISFKIDWLDLHAVQGTLKSLLQHHSSKASILERSALFIVQLSHTYMTTGKTIALTRQTFNHINIFTGKLCRIPREVIISRVQLLHLSSPVESSDHSPSHPSSDSRNDITDPN